MNIKFLQNFETVSQKLEALGKTERWKEGKTRICAWQVPRTTAEFLRLLVVSTNSKTIFELGTSIGYSGIWLGLGVKETKGHLYTTEIFMPKIELAKKHFKDAGLEKQITILEGDIKDSISKFKKKIDFVFMDARKEDYLNYYNWLFPKLKKGGVIVADNIDDFPHYMKDFLEHIKKDQKIISYHLHLDHGLMIIVKK